MTEKIRNRPVNSSVILTFALTVFWVGASMFFDSMLFFSAANIVIAILAVFLLGKVNQTNGFRFVFKTKGLAKGLLVLIPVAAFFLFGLFLRVGTGGISAEGIENMWILPTAALTQATSALVQNALFRGLLITALFVKASGTADERIRSVFKAAALYLAIYIPLNIFIGAGFNLLPIVNTFVVGAGFCAAYMYSRNLLSIVLVQGLWQFLNSVITLFGTNDYQYPAPLTFLVPQLFILILMLLFILILIVTFAVIFSKRAKPFGLSGSE